VLVAGQDEVLAQLLAGQPLALPEEESVAGDVALRAQAVQGRGGRQHQHVETAGVGVAQPVQCLQPFADQVLVRRQDVEGQRLPVGQGPHRQRRIEIRDFIDQALCVVRVGCDDDRQLVAAVRGACSLSNEQRIGRAGRARQGEAPPRRRWRRRQFNSGGSQRVHAGVGERGAESSRGA